MPDRAFQRCLQLFLRARSLQQKDLAARLHMAQSTLTKLLTKDAPIDPGTLDLICNRLDLSNEESQELSDLNKAATEVQMQDSNTETVSVDTTLPARSIDFMVPAQVAHFIGRESELQAVLTQLHPSHVVTICGPVGMGKTALAIQVAHTMHLNPDLSERFPDGIFFIDFQNEKKTADPVELEQIAFEQLARVFGEKPNPTPLAAAQRVLAERTALIIFDGTERLSDVQGLLNIRGNCGILLTSRRRSDIQFESVDLCPLPPDAAVELLQAWGQKWAHNDEAVSEICELVEHLPLALVLIGSYLASRAQDADEYLEWLREARLDALEGEERQKTSIALLLEQSFRQLSHPAQQAIRIAGSLAYSAFSPDTIAAAVAQSVTAVRRQLGEGINYSLLQRSGDRFAFTHSLIHIYAQERGPLPKLIADRLAAYFVQLAQRNGGLGALGHKRLDSEQVHMMAVLTQCIEQELWQPVSNLVQNIDPYLAARGHWFEWQVAVKYALDAVRHLDQVHQEAQLLSTLASIFNRLGRFNEALTTYAESLKIFQQLGDQRGIAGVQMGWGLALYFKSRLEEAVEWYAQSIRNWQALYTESHDANTASSLGKVLSNQGNAHADLGRSDEALEYYQQSLELQQLSGDRFSEAQVLGNLALLLLDKNQMEEAIALLERAREIFGELGESLNGAQTLLNLGDAYRRQNNLEKALQENRVAYRVFQEIGYRRGESIALRGMGEVYHGQQLWDDAIEMCKKSLAIANELDSPLLEGQTLHALGNVLRDKKSWADARTTYLAAQTIFIEAETSYHEGLLLIDMGILHQMQEQMVEAMQLWREALEKLPPASPEYQKAQSWLEIYMK